MGLASSTALVLLAAAQIGIASPSRAQDLWSWVHLQPSDQGRGWAVRQGRAVLTIDPGGGFHTELDVDGSELRQHYRLAGGTRQGRVKAQETLLNSDAPRLSYVGEAEAASPDHPACLHLHSGGFAIHLCKDSPP